MPALGFISKKAKLVILWIALLVGAALIYCEIRGVFPPGVGTLVSLGFIGAIGLVFAILGLPLGRNVQATGGRLIFFAKTAAWLVASLVWTGVVVRLVPDDAVGAVILLVPFFGMFGTSVFFLARALGFGGNGHRT